MTNEAVLKFDLNNPYRLQDFLVTSRAHDYLDLLRKIVSELQGRDWIAPEIDNVVDEIKSALPPATLDELQTRFLPPEHTF